MTQENLVSDYNHPLKHSRPFLPGSEADPGRLSGFTYSKQNFLAFRVSVDEQTLSKFGNDILIDDDERTRQELPKGKVSSARGGPAAHKAHPTADKVHPTADKDHASADKGQSTAAADKSRPESDLTSLQKDIARLDLKIDDGIELVVKNGRCEYHMLANGRDNVLFTTPDTVEGRKLAQSKIHEMEEQKVIEIEKKYRVQIARPSEFVAADKKHPHEPCRRPTLAELTALDQALSLNDTGAPVEAPFKFYFMKNQLDPSDLAEYKIIDGQPAVLIAPSAITHPPTEADIRNWPNGYEPGDSLVETFTHEFAHRTEDRNGKGIAVSVPSPELPPELANHKGERVFEQYAPNERHKDLEAYKKMGWKNVGGWWALEGADGHLYRRITTSDHAHRWIQVNSSGKPIDARGKETSEDQAVYRTNEQMKQIARVTPASDYFRMPHEMYAEGLAHFRIGNDARAHLLKTSPQLYELMKQRDQDDINRRYALRNDGTPSMIRRNDGLVVPNTPANQKQIQEFEAKAKV